MTQSVNPVPAAAPTVPTPTARSAPASWQGGAAPVTVEVSRAASAPVYVYRVTDTATGRILVEIPQQPAAPPGEGAGRRVDAKV